MGIVAPNIMSVLLISILLMGVKGIMIICEGYCGNGSEVMSLVK